MAAKNSEKFEDALERLEKIVRALEEGDLSLEESLARYEEGVKTLKNCYEILRNAEKRIEIITKDEQGNLRIEPFEPEEKRTADDKGRKTKEEG